MSRKSFVLLLTICFTLSLAFAALAQVTKDEVVYAALHADGSVKEIYVVNTYESDETAEVTDYAAYTRALPLGRSDDFSYGDGKAAFTLNPGRFAYQGDLESKALPWLVSLSYTLDGQQAEPLSLSGTNGRVEGRIKIAINPEFSAIAESLSLQVSVTLDGDKCLNIVADKATLAHAAGNLALTYVILPGQEAEYTFSFDANDFSMPAIQIAGIRMGMDQDMYKQVAVKAMAGSPFESSVGNLMGGFLTAMEGRKAVSFTDSRNQVRAVQFVMMTEEIPEKAVEIPETSAETAEDANFFERLGKLLGL